MGNLLSGKAKAEAARVKKAAMAAAVSSAQGAGSSTAPAEAEAAADVALGSLPSDDEDWSTDQLQLAARHGRLDGAKRKRAAEPQPAAAAAPAPAEAAEAPAEAAPAASGEKRARAAAAPADAKAAAAAAATIAPEIISVKLSGAPTISAYRHEPPWAMASLFAPGTRRRSEIDGSLWRVEASRSGHFWREYPRLGGDRRNRSSGA